MDGWSVTDLEEVINNDNPVEEIKEEKIEESTWCCEACTLENPDSNQICAACDSNRPPKRNEIEFEEVQHTNMDAIEKEMQKRDQNRFLQIIDDINLFVENYYLDVKK